MCYQFVVWEFHLGSQKCKENGPILKTKVTGRCEGFHSFSLYGPPSRQITYIYLRGKNNISAILHYFMDNILRFYILLLFPKIICHTINFSHVLPLINVTTTPPPNVRLTFLVEQIDMCGFPYTKRSARAFCGWYVSFVSRLMYEAVFLLMCQWNPLPRKQAVTGRAAHVKSSFLFNL